MLAKNKSVHKSGSKKASVIYLGTTEAVAKLAPHKGITPYQVPIGSVHWDKDNDYARLYLSSVYPGFFAFDTTLDIKQRWGIVEIDLSALSNENSMLPYEGYLVHRSRKKIQDHSHYLTLMANYRKVLSSHRERWRESLHESGVCLHVGSIPAGVIRRVAVYDPVSNKFITNHILNTLLLAAKHKESYHRNDLLTRWLMAEVVEVEDWLGKELPATGNDNCANISTALMNKDGLDIFYTAGTK